MDVERRGGLGVEESIGDRARSPRKREGCPREGCRNLEGKEVLSDKSESLEKDLMGIARVTGGRGGHTRG